MENEMIKTTIHVCKKCRFSEWSNNSNVTCGYFSMTKKLRNCPIGLCDKYEQRRKKRK
jgi:predicted metal-binding protein